MRKIIILFCLTSLLASCEKYLETPPDQRAVLDSPEKISELLTAAYPRASYFAFAESMSDNAKDKGPQGGSITYINYDPWMFTEVRSRNQDTPDFYWYACYKAISVANRALAHIEEVQDPERYRAQKGEALVARAYAHFMLVIFFSQVYDPYTADTAPGIPYVTTPEESLLVKYERKTVAYVYQQIEKDLREGLPLINDSQYRVPKFHFTRAATHAFASRFYLFKQDYEKVITHASQVFTNGDFSANLRPTNSPEFRSKEYYSKQADYTKAENPANILLVEAVSQWGESYPVFRFGLTSDLLAELFYSGNVTSGNYAYMIYGNETTYNIPKFRGHFVRTDINANFGIMYNMVPLFTAEEVLLNRAEAYAATGATDAAIADLNVFASKKIFASQNNPVFIPQMHQITPSKLLQYYQETNLRNCLVQAVLDFKRREYLFEGMRYLDILRHHIPVVHEMKDGSASYTLTPNDLRRTLQLPQEVVMSGIEANPR